MFCKLTVLIVSIETSLTQGVVAAEVPEPFFCVGLPGSEQSSAHVCFLIPAQDAVSKV